MYAQSYHCGFFFSCFLVLRGSERTVSLEEWLPDLQPTGTVPDRPAPYRQYGVRQDPWTLHPRSLWSPWHHVQPHHEEQHAYRSVGRCSLRGSNIHSNYCLFLYLGHRMEGYRVTTNYRLFLPQRSESRCKNQPAVVSFSLRVQESWPIIVSFYPRDRRVG